ncbi:AAA family ATPase [Candidatus Dojkabacteria bacterium]|nr:AAA family ATPase [Candidatus Dojkabacteria bacterium]
MPEEQTTQLAEVLYLIKKLEGEEGLKLPQGLREQIDLKLKRLRRMARQGQMSGEYEPIAKYIDWCLAIPWGISTTDNLDLPRAKEVMDQLHYSHNDVKEIILEYLAVLNRKTQLRDENITSPVLAFVGVQGAGKTSLAKAIAQALGRQFTRISLGAVGSSSALRGTTSTDANGFPGQIVKALVKAKSMNPVILLDEFDKVSGSAESRADFMAIMLEILDPQQNTTFKDQYLDYPVDLSKVLFIATANSFTTISRELLDRLEIIPFPDYPFEDKVEIAKRFLFPQTLSYAGLQEQDLKITDDVWPEVVRKFATDEGVRRLERNLQKMARRVVKRIVLGQVSNLVIDSSNVADYTSIVLPSISEVRNIDYTKGDKKYTSRDPLGSGIIEEDKISKIAENNSTEKLESVSSDHGIPINLGESPNSSSNSNSDNSNNQDTQSNLNIPINQQNVVTSTPVVKEVSTDQQVYTPSATNSSVSNSSMSTEVAIDSPSVVSSLNISESSVAQPDVTPIKEVNVVGSQNDNTIMNDHSASSNLVAQSDSQSDASIPF